MPSQRNRPLQGRAIPFHRHPTTSEGIPVALRRKAAASAPLENEQPEPFIPSSRQGGPPRIYPPTRVNDGSQTGYVDAGYMEWAYDIVVETTAEAMRLNSTRTGSLGLPMKKDVSKHISGLVVVLVAAQA